METLPNCWWQLTRMREGTYFVLYFLCIVLSLYCTFFSLLFFSSLFFSFLFCSDPGTAVHRCLSCERLSLLMVMLLKCWWPLTTRCARGRSCHFPFPALEYGAPDRLSKKRPCLLMVMLPNCWWQLTRIRERAAEMRPFTAGTS